MVKRTLSVIALGGLLLTGCGGTTDVERSPVNSPEVITPIMPTEATESTDAVPDPSSTVVPEPTAIPSGSNEPPQDPGVDSSSAGSDPTSEGEATPETSIGGPWVSIDATVKTAADVEKLTQTPADFRSFLTGLVNSSNASGCASEFVILAYHVDGYAAGHESSTECGGAQNIWGKIDGEWWTLMAMQSVVECADLEGNEIPKGLPDIPCLDPNGDAVDW